MLRYLIYDGDELIRKVGTREECNPYISSGCRIKVLPKPKKPTTEQLLELVGDAPF
mgnify:CR=1 FL=1